ncbi:condensin-2 complex subunit H2-like isoform X2 [Stylophora pistillata]|uniref:Condensin-2 complex subunit H2 n=1 Tax=Stylophora pistillata TaxID=50429 RepID=A0A2B4S9M6_STYPI|nr:condensin-2 complex subunit H2-like isoform X2 [Stylophora pistillata]PFX25500.1 Condensin-2 complex subunit H2 [Stylophora pistillata]
MPSPEASGDLSDVASRYIHLLQPIRDLTKNWDIDVAAQLEEYLAEIEKIKISFDGGKTTMNFAEAALLIQGSACIYSRKVEYLYTLVYQTLDLIASKKRLQQVSTDDSVEQEKKGTKGHTKEYRSWDDIKVSKNIDLKEDDDSDERKSSLIVPRIPLALIPLPEEERGDVLLSHNGEAIGRKNDFKMNTCVVHGPTGTLLLDWTHLSLIDDSFKGLKPATPSVMTGMEPRTDEQSTNYGIDAAENYEELGLPDADDNFDPPELMDDDALDSCNNAPNNCNEFVTEETQNDQEERRELRARPETQQVKQAQQLPFKDPWKMLDPHDPGTSQDKPFKKGKPFKKPSSLVSHQQKKKRKHKEDKKQPTLVPINQFISQAFYSHASKMSKNSLKIPSFPEFEYLYWVEYREKQKLQAKLKKVLYQVATKEEIEELNSIVENAEENEDGQIYGDDGNEAGCDAPAEYDDDDDDDDFGGGVDEGLDFGSAEVLEPIALEEPADGVVISSYEEMVRKYVDSYLLEARQQYAQETELSRRVREWEERIMPVLSEEETHRPFDIHKYGKEILDSFKGNTIQDFRELAHEKEPFEICRFFLATLQLANNYNVEITADGVGERAVDTMRLTLLKRTPGNVAIATFGGRAST